MRRGDDTKNTIEYKLMEQVPGFFPAFYTTRTSLFVSRGENLMVPLKGDIIGHKDKNYRVNYVCISSVHGNDGSTLSSRAIVGLMQIAESGYNESQRRFLNPVSNPNPR
ncbi:MAG: hypothetical protein AABX05_03865 [Nanoarchaeota archaeon]